MFFFNQNIILKNFPISFFSVVLGLLSFAIATQKIEILFFEKIIYGNIFVGFNILIFLFLCIFYFLKIFLFFDDVKKEFFDLMKNSFFSTFSIIFLLFSIAFLEIDESISFILLIIGIFLHIIITLIVVILWIQKEVDIKYISPIWFMPAIGNFLIPISGYEFLSNLSWFFFGVGIFFGIILTILLFYKLIFTHQLQDKLLPTLFIILSLFSVFFISYMKIVNNFDNFAKFLISVVFLIFLLLLFSFNLFYKLNFYLNWWFFSFPISSFIISNVLIYKFTNFVYFKYFSLFLYIFLIFLIFLLFIKTLKAILNKQICIE